MKYYFVSYSYTDDKGFGFGSCHVIIDGEFFLKKKVSEKLGDNAVILYYKEISKEEHEANL